MKKGLLTLISGSSGVGKNTVIDKLVNKHKDYILLRSSTTRARRVDDKIQKDGKEVYNFLTKEEFESKISAGEMLEYDIFSGNYYGVSKGSIEEALKDYPFVLKDITVKGAINSQVELSGKVNITTIFLTLRKSLLKKRLIRRQTKNETLQIRTIKYTVV